MPPERTNRPRQDPVSCDSCRKKKLKCDRNQPCSNCRSRAIQCVLQGRSFPIEGQQSGNNGASLAVLTGHDGLNTENAAIRARLLRLEDIVLGGRPASAPATTGTDNTSSTAASTAAAATTAPMERDDEDSPEEANLKAFSGDSHWLEGVGSRENWRIPHLSSAISVNACPIDAIVAGSHPHARVEGVVMVPQYELAKVLAASYLHHVDTLQHIVYMPSLNAMLDEVYGKLGRGEPLNLSHTALLMAVLSSIAAHYSFAFNTPDQETFFESRQVAVSVALYWLKSTLDVIEKARRTDLPTLETVQATIIILFLIFHIETFSPKARFLHSSAVIAAKEIGLHLTDTSDNVKRRGNLTRAQIIDIEMRRRVWWHLCATDWSMALVGGPQEGTYLIDPKQMRTLKPRNITDEDLATQSIDFNRPMSEPTPMSYYHHRIRLGELCREVADLNWEMLAGADPEQIPYDTIVSFDRRFDELLHNLPGNLRLDETIPANDTGLPNQLTTLRYFTNLTIEARRCKLHLPFMLRVPRNDRYNFSRTQCLRSARAILQLRHICFSGKSINPNVPMNIFLHHFFSAILMLVMDLCVNRRIGDEKARAEEVRAACTLLEAARGQSAAAGVFLESLLAILRKHKVRIAQMGDPFCAHGASNGTASLAAFYGNSATASANQPMQDATAASNSSEDVQSMNFDELWQGYLDLDSSISPQEWDALFSDLDSAL